MSFRKDLLPFARCRWKTQISQPEVLRRIEDSLQPEKRHCSFQTAATKPYEGRVTGSTFRMSRVISYRNSFLPQIRGQVVSEGDCIAVEIRMRPSLFVLLFMGAWLGAVGLVCMVCLVVFASALLHTGDSSYQRLSPVWLMPFGLFAFGLALCNLGFRSEVAKTKQFFDRLLQASADCD